jgi:hypothetical protein
VPSTRGGAEVGCSPLASHWPADSHKEFQLPPLPLLAQEAAGQTAVLTVVSMERQQRTVARPAVRVPPPLPPEPAETVSTVVVAVEPVVDMRLVALAWLVEPAAHRVTAQMAPQPATVVPPVLTWWAVAARTETRQRSEVE